MKPRMRSSVSVVMRPPLRSRLASLPSLTARRPKVDSARPAWRQKSEISCRMASFMGGVLTWPRLREPCGAANQAADWRSTTNGPIDLVGKRRGVKRNANLLPKFAQKWAGFELGGGHLPMARRDKG